MFGCFGVCVVVVFFFLCLSVGKIVNEGSWAFCGVFGICHECPSIRHSVHYSSRTIWSAFYFYVIRCKIFSYCCNRRIVAHLVNFQFSMINFPLRLLEKMIFCSEG